MKRLLGGTTHRAVGLLVVFTLVLGLMGQLLAQEGTTVSPADAMDMATIQPAHFSFDPAEGPERKATRAANLDAALATLADQNAGGAALASIAGAAGLKVDGDLVEVIAEVDAENVAAAQQALAAAGGRVVYTSLDNTQIQALAPIAALRALAADPAIAYLRQPDYLMPSGELQVGQLTTVGVTHANATAWHNAGYRGAGVRIAVIDGGFEGYTALPGTDLPASVVVQNFASTGDIGGGTPHGTACAEIVYDMAPQASLYLLRINTNLDLQRAVTYAIANGITVISTSLGFYNVAPGDSTGFLANEVARARNAGITWVTAAGNERERHWGGIFNDTDSDQFHEFAPGVEINCIAAAPGGDCLAIPAGYTFRAFLRWDNWTPPVNQDYDFFIVRWNGTTWQIVSTGANFQNGDANQRPTEAAGVRTSGDATAYGIIIQRFNATRADVNLNLFVAGVPALRQNVPARSLADLADAPGAITVAALDARNPFPQERYSSEGPTNGPGGTLNGGIIKPDLAAFANVDTVAYGTTVGQQFNGTSSATPHVAGAAALVRGAFAGYGPAQITAFLTGRAIEMGSPGRDTLFGYGRLWLGEPPANDVTPSPSPSPSPPSPSPSPSPPSPSPSPSPPPPPPPPSRVNLPMLAAPKPPTRLAVAGDANVISGRPDTNFGRSTTLWVGSHRASCTSGSFDGGASRGLVRFNLPTVPPGQTISRATLYLRAVGLCRGNGAASAIAVRAYQITQNWDPGTVTWTTQPPGGAEVGSVAIPFAAESLTWHAIDITEQLRRWVSGAQPNYGLMLRANESTEGNFVFAAFATSELSQYSPYVEVVFGPAPADIATP